MLLFFVQLLDLLELHSIVLFDSVGDTIVRAKPQRNKLLHECDDRQRCLLINIRKARSISCGWIS